MFTASSLVRNFSCLTRFSLASAIALALASGWVSSAAIGAPPEADQEKFAPGRILVKFKPGVPEHVMQKLLDKHQGKAARKIGKHGVRVISVPEKAETALVRALSKESPVEFAELDRRVAPGTMTANDPNYSGAWHLPKIQAPLAWENALGQGVTVAILDTGVDGSHPDLINKLVPGWNAVSQNSDSSDINGHGTAVAGTAAAESNNALGVTSVAWDARLMPVRITNASDGWAYWSDVANGLYWAADNGARVANISYEGLTNSSTITNAAQYMRNKGGVVVVAAGNSGNDTGESENPALISVSATDGNDNRASWSSHGAYIDVAAPGVSIWTTNRGGSYGRWNGTSFASPVTAGVAALIMGLNPALSPDDIEYVLESTADDVGTAGWDQYYGHGRINADGAVLLALNSVPSDTLAPTVSIASPGADGTVSDQVAVEVSAQDNVGVTEVKLYANGEWVGSDLVVPYAFSWDSTQVADGDVTLVAYAYDAANNEGLSQGVTVTVSNNTVEAVPDTMAPEVAITSPTEGSSVNRRVIITAQAQDDVGIAMLTLSLDGKTLCFSNMESLSCTWNTRKASDGEHTITAKAEDTAGNSTTSSITVMKGTSSSTDDGGNGKGNGKGKK